MKQLAAFLLVALFICTQYSRQLTYLDCKLDNISNGTESKCDCEQQYASAQDDDHPDFPAHKNHRHFSIDDYYLGESRSTTDISFSFVKHYPELSIQFISRDVSNVFHPPGA